MPEYYAGAPNAFLGGLEFAAAQRRRRAGDNALRALIEQYGPAAADPTALGQLQGIEQRAALHPLSMQQGQLAVKQGQQAVTANQRGFEEQDRARLLSAGQRAAFFLEKAKQNGGDLGAAFDRVQRILPAFGVDTAQLGSIREQLVSNPDSVDELVAMFRGETGATRATGNPIPVYDEQGVPRLLQTFSDGTTRMIDGVAPAATVQGQERIGQGWTRLGQGQERLQQGWANLDWDQIKEHLPARQQGVQLFQAEDGRVVADIVPGSPAEQELAGKLQEMTAGDRKMLQSYGVVSDHAGTVATNVDRALDYFSGANAGVLLQSLRSGARRVPGTDAYDAWDALETIKNNVAVDELQRMRQSSPTGGALGQVSDRDIALLTGALGRLEVERDPARLVEDLRSIQRMYGRIIQFAREDAERAQGRMQIREQRQGTSFGPQPRPTPGAPSPAPAAEPSIDDLLEMYQ